MKVLQKQLHQWIDAMLLDGHDIGTKLQNCGLLRKNNDNINIFYL
jgi:hypothetical protein